MSDGVVLEIEQNLLGALLMGSGLQFVRSFLRADHFLDVTHRQVFEAIEVAHDRSGASDMPYVCRMIPDDVHEQFRLRMGTTLAQYLAKLMADTTAASEKAISRAGRNVVEQHARISFAATMFDAGEAARQPMASIATLLKSTGSAIEEIGMSVRSLRSARSRVTIEEAGHNVLQLVSEAQANGGRLTGTTWGLADVDRLTGGMQRKDLILMGARPSMGKTSAMTSIGLAAARSGVGIGILSLEMDATKLTARALSDLSHRTRNPIPYRDMLQGQVGQTGFDDMSMLVDDLRSLPIEIDDAAANVFDIRTRVEGMQERFRQKQWPRLGVLMIDHLGFVEPGTSYRGNRNNEIGEITRALKDIAKEHDLTVMLLSQLSRQLATRENKRPILSDLRDSGNIEQDADVVVFLHREAYYLDRTKEEGEKEIDRLEKLDACRHDLEFIIAKNRNGPVETVNLWCDMAYSAVRNGDRYGYAERSR